MGNDLVKGLFARDFRRLHAHKAHHMVKPPKLSLRMFFVYGLFSGVIATLATYVGTTFLGLPFPPEEIFQLLISSVPGSIQSVTVETFGEYAKYTAFVAASGIYALLYAFIGTLVGFLYRNDLPKSGRPILAGSLIGFLISVALEGALAGRVYILSTLFGWFIAAGLLLVVNLCYSIILVSQAKTALRDVSPKPIPRMAQTISSSRRGFLKKAAIVGAVLVFAGVSSKIILSLLSGQPVVQSGTVIPVDPQSSSVNLSDLPSIFQDPRLSSLVGSEVTDNRVFYRVDIDPLPPQLDLDKWTLKVDGKVSDELLLNKDGFMALPTKDEYATLECVSNTIYPPSALISNAKWTGVPLATILNQAGLSSDAKYVVFHCADGYTVGIPLDRAKQPGSLLAYKMNDQFLPNEHGFPLRAIVPGIYGMMNAKWITEIEVTDQVYLGYWQERGWSNDARIKTTSLIYYPGDRATVSGALPIGGIAFAGDRGISKVEVSTDAGSTWNEATIKQPRSPYSWVIWAYEWTPQAKGAYTLMVRAYDGSNQLQSSAATAPFPDGASGYHSIQVTVN